MASPFPGMDPYLEQHWGDVHPSFITYARDQLQPHLASPKHRWGRHFCLPYSRRQTFLSAPPATATYGAWFPMTPCS